jgi:hypothetical protein
MNALRKLGMAVLIALAFVGCNSQKNATTPTPNQNNSQATVKPTVDPEIAELDKQIEIAKKQKELQKILNETSIDPCGDYYDDENYYREYGIAINVNKASAQSESIDVAKENIRKHMAEYVQGLSSSYRNLYAGSKDFDDIQRKMEGKMLATVDGMLNALEKLCQEYSQDNHGRYVYYYAGQISKKDFKRKLTEDLNKLSDDEKLDIDFRDQQFQKFMDERLQQQLEAKKNAGY